MDTLPINLTTADLPPSMQLAPARPVPVVNACPNKGCERCITAAAAEIAARRSP